MPSRKMRVAYDLREIAFQGRGWERCGMNLLREMIALPDLEFLFIVEDEAGTLERYPFLGDCRSRLVTQALDREPDEPRRRHSELERCDIYHCLTEFPDYVTDRARTVVTIHDTSFRICPDLLRPGWVEIAGEALEHALTGADGIVLFTDWVRSNVVEFRNERGLPSRCSIRKLPFGIDHLAAVRPAEQIPAGIGCPYLLYVGGFEPDKNLAALLRVFAQDAALRETFDLVLAGPNVERPDPSSQVLELPDLHLLGEIDDRQLCALYRDAAWFVTASLDEGFGISPLEALWFETPVICSDIPPFRETMLDSALYFDPHSGDDLRGHLHGVARGGDMGGRLLARRKEILAPRRWRACAEQALAFYQELLAG